jgi:hypothetical protein
MIILSMHIVKLASDVMTSFIHIKAKTMPIKGLTSKHHQASGHYLLVEKQIQSTKRVNTSTFPSTRKIFSANHKQTSLF